MMQNIQAYINIVVHHIINSYPIDVVLEKRCIKCIWNLINSGCKLHADIVILSMDNMYSTIGENMRYFIYQYNFSTNDWYRPLSFLNDKIDTYVNSTVNFDIVCTATAIKELCQARDMGDTQLFNRQELTTMIKHYVDNNFSILRWFLFYIPMMSRLLYAKLIEHFICLCTYSI